jgi:hypothetical protein
VPATPDSWGADELDALLARPGDGPVARILAAAAAPAQAGPLPGEDAAIAAFRKAFSGQPHVLGGRTSQRAAAAVLAGGLVLSGGAAAAGVLPGAMQQTAKDMFARVGVTVPGPKAHTTPGTTTPVPAVSPEPTAGGPGASSSGNGSDVSDLAHSTTATGVDKGAALSSAASDGKSQAGQHGNPGGVTPTPHAGTPPSTRRPTAPPSHTPTPQPTDPATPHSPHTLASQPTPNRPPKAGP